MISDSSHLAPAASTAAAWAFAAAACTAGTALVTLAALLHSYRLPGGGEPGATGLDRWGVLAMALQVGFGVLPIARHPADPSLIPRAVAAIVCGALAAALAVWEVSARLRYRDRSLRVSAARRFLTYGPYRRMRRPRDLAALLLLAGINCVRLPPEALVPLVAITAWAFYQRARWYDDAAAAVLGNEYDDYCAVVPLFLPAWRRDAERPGV